VELKRGHDDRAEEGGAAADQPGQAQPAPGGPDLGRGQRADDAEAFGDVVEGEPDDQESGQGQLAAGGRLADGQPLGEVVQADAAAMPMPVRRAAAWAVGSAG
jgi:hypothetical protein